MGIRIGRVVCPVTLLSAETSGDSVDANARSENADLSPATSIAETPIQRLPAAEASVSVSGSATVGHPDQSRGLTQLGSAPPSFERGDAPPGNVDRSRNLDLADDARFSIGLTDLGASAGGMTISGIPLGPTGRPLTAILPSIARLATTIAEDVAAQAQFSTWAANRLLPAAPSTVEIDRRIDDSAMRALNPDAVRSAAITADPSAPLADEERVEMEEIVGGDLKDVRIHTGRSAAATAAALGAEAFAIGHDVFFAQGRFDPGSTEGRALLAHELVHVRQQTRAGENRIQSSDGATDAAETEAENVERAVLAQGQGSGGGNLSVGTYTRNYSTPDGRLFSRRDRARLDGISMRALDLCQRTLGPAFFQGGRQEIQNLRVDLSLDLSSLTDEQAADIWGRALADALRSRAGNSNGTPGPRSPDTNGLGNNASPTRGGQTAPDTGA